MSEQNPYSAPQADLAEPEVELQLGGRGERLGAVIIDGLMMMAILLPAMFMTGYFSGVMQGVKPSYGMQMLWGVLGFVVFVVVQGYPLSESGQTWGKKLLKLKIVDLQGAKPDFLKLIAMRYGIGAVIQLIPIAGSIYGLVDALFIFREDKRCIHDHLAGTRVVIAK